MSKRVFGQIGRLKKDKINEYVKLHKEEVHLPKWKGVLEMIQACNMCNYSIFIQDDVVFGYFEYVGENYEQDMLKMSNDPTTQAWWSLTKPCFTNYCKDSKEAFYSDMQQIFSDTGSL